VIATTGHNDAMLYRRLVEARVLCSLRGAGIRFSPHYYTTASNLEHLARQLKMPSP
jgi:selenocysteine lyase/cysteine desulfurase